VPSIEEILDSIKEWQQEEMRIDGSVKAIAEIVKKRPLKLIEQLKRSMIVMMMTTKDLRYRPVPN
jgi:hypothetical protein